MDGDLLALPKLILDADLNFTLNANDIWGKKALLDPLALFFSQLISDFNLVDISPTFVGFTWRNGRAWDDRISKRHDRFLI